MNIYIYILVWILYTWIWYSFRLVGHCRLTIGYHRIMYTAFRNMHFGCDKRTAAEFFKDAKAESKELVSATELVADTTESDRYRKEFRIKSWKSYEWLRNEASAYHLLIAH